MAAWKLATSVIAATLAAPIGDAQAESIRWELGGTFDCTGVSVGKQSVKFKCLQKEERGNRIYTNIANFTISGPAAKQYLGKHKSCTHVPAGETRWNQDFMACPGIPEWWKK